MFNKTFLAVILISLPVFAQAKKLAAIEVAEQISLYGQQLKLNGAGIRTKFIFDIYVAAFYTSGSVKNVADLDMQKPMRMAMHFVYDEVSKEKLVDAWNDGFEDNLNSAQFSELKAKITKFNALFETARAGDVINLDFSPLSGTTIYINKKNKGTIEGAEFYRALLLIWLGEDPVGDDLKDALLGSEASE